MSKMIQIRHVPDKLHRTLKVRAAQDGKSLSEFLLTELKSIAERPTLAETLGRIHARSSGPANLDSAALLRQERESR